MGSPKAKLMRKMVTRRKQAMRMQLAQARMDQNQSQPDADVDDRTLFVKMNSLKAHMMNGTLDARLASGRKLA